MKAKVVLRGLTEARGLLQDLRETIDSGTNLCVIVGEHAARVKATALGLLARPKKPPLKITVTAVRSQG